MIFLGRMLRLLVNPRKELERERECEYDDY